ncbi:long-chain fatty acid--CoA ligase [soil metagenome]
MTAPDRRWLSQYPATVPHEIDTGRFATLVELAEAAFAKYGERPAYRSMGVAMSYAQVDLASRRFAAYLQSLGLGKGTRVAIMMPNCLQYPIALFGILRTGCTVVSVNPLYTARELEHQLVDSGAEAIVVLENFAGVLAEVVARTRVKHVVVSGLGDQLGLLKGRVVNLVVRRVKKLVPPYSLPGHVKFNAALSIGAGKPFSKAAITPDDLAFLQYTGGTTGVSKGAMLLHRNIVANVLQCAAWYQPALQKIPEGTQIVKVTALPLYHIFALTACALLGMQIGACLLLLPNARDLPAVCKALKQQPFHVLPAVNTLFNALLNHPDFADVDCRALILSVGGGMAVQGPVARRWLERTGCAIIEGYGLSETSPTATCNPTDAIEYTGTIGLPVPNTDISIRDDAGATLGIGETGEICIRGPQVMAGYWNQPAETARAMTADGYFKSGDIGIMDDRGYTRIVDRKKDMILVSGFNVYPNEVEEVVAGCPGVQEVAAIGVPDLHSGETVKVYVVRMSNDAGRQLGEQQVLDYARGQLTGYKRPRTVEFCDSLPKTNVGKILRRELRDSALRKIAEQDAQTAS